MEYATALASARQFAGESLQPVLMLGRYGHAATTNLSGIAEWATQKGAIVLFVEELSFQDRVRTWMAGLGFDPMDDHYLGPWLRLDVPFLVQKYKLFESPNICDRHILYRLRYIVCEPNHI